MKYLVTALLLVVCSILPAQEGARYLILCRDEYVPAIKPLAEWKHATGLRTKIVPLSEVGADTASVHEYVLDAWTNWPVRPEYVLLVAHPSYMRAKIHGHTPDMIYSDNYFGDLAGDFRAEIPTGRFPARSVAQCELMVAKTLMYEQTPPLDDSLWMRRLTTVVREDYDPDDSIYRQNARYAATLARVNGFVSCDSLSRARGHTSTDVVQSIDNGTGIVMYRGSGTGNWRWPFGINPAQCVNNNRLPIVLSITCAMMALDPYDSMVGSAWIKTGATGNLRGAVAYFGNTWSDNGVAPERSAVARGFFTGLFSDGAYRMGNAMLRAKRQLYDEFPAEQAKADYRGFNLFGDPALPIWTATPRRLDVDHPARVRPEPQSLVVTVLHDGAPVAGAYVCASMDSTVYAFDSTDAAGRVGLSVSPADTGLLRLVVTGHNLYPYSVAIRVTTASGIFGENPALRADPARLNATPSAFTTQTRLNWSAPAARQPTLAIRSATGRCVRTFTACGSSVVWNGLGDDGRPAGPGVYFAALTDRGHTLARTRLTRLR